MLCPIARTKSLRSRLPSIYWLHNRNSRSCVDLQAFVVFCGDSVPTACRSIFDDASTISACNCNASSSRQTDGFVSPTHFGLFDDNPWDVRPVSAKRLLIKKFVGEMSCRRNFRILPLNAIINDYRGTARFSALRITICPFSI